MFVDTEALPWHRYYQVAAGPDVPPVPVYTNRFAWIPAGRFTNNPSQTDYGLGFRIALLQVP